MHCIADFEFFKSILMFQIIIVFRDCNGLILSHDHGYFMVNFESSIITDNWYEPQTGQIMAN